MNLKDFKKIHDDEHKAVLKNAKGHSITLAKKALTKSYLENLNKLPLHAAEGATIGAPEEFVPGKDYSTAPLPGDPIATPVNPTTIPASDTPQAAPLSPLQQKYNDLLQEDSRFSKSTARYDRFKITPGVEPSEVDEAMLSRAQKDLDREQQRQAERNQKQDEQKLKQSGLKRALGFEPKSTEASPQDGLLGQPQEPADTKPQQPAPRAPQTAPMAEQPGLGSANQMTDRASAEAAAPPQTPEQHAQAITAEADEEDDKYWRDLAQGRIKPKTISDLFAEKSTVGKIGTLFGLLLSGAGSGLSKQPNALLELMDKELQRDLEAQKDASAKMQNYFRLSVEAELNRMKITREQAETAGVWKDVESKALINAKNKMLLGVTSKLMSDADMLPDGPMKQSAMQQIGVVQGAAAQQIKRNNMELGQKLANDPEGAFQKKQAGLRAAGTLGILPGAEALANENEARHIPSIGTFTQAVPPAEKIKMVNQLEFEKAARKYVEFAKKHQMNWANLNPVQRMKIANEGNVLAAELQGKYRIKTQGGVYKESEQDFINKIIPDKAASWQAFFNQIPKVTKAMETNLADLENTAKSYGGAAPRYNPRDGKYYTRGPNGEAVEVK